MSVADEAEKILAWVMGDVPGRIDEGIARHAALNVPYDDPESNQVRGVGEVLANQKNGVEYLKQHP